MNKKNKDGFRICNKCQTEKELNADNFHRSKSRPMGFEYKCKLCERNRCATHKKEWSKFTQEQKDKAKIRNKKYIKIHKLRLRPHFIFKSYFRTDTLKGMECDLTLEYIKTSLLSNCYYCGFPPTGLDRINNKIGHTINNTVPCCKECNVARMDNFSHEEMFIIGKAIKEIKEKRLSIIPKN